MVMKHEGAKESGGALHMRFRQIKGSQKRGFLRVIAERLSLVFLRVARPEICVSSLSSMQVIVLPLLKTEVAEEYCQQGVEALHRFVIRLSWRRI
ncbi:hypothetical protein ABTW56_12625 [Enterobacter roggenkampii]|uniref:hypothetical protein n=1 Tax=Enterobacter roggenkampii TaxID=1812935 RepID=UPI003314638A